MKVKSNFSISKKLFLITFGLIAIVLGFSMLFQTLFFEDFYLNRRVNSLIEETSKFSDLYSYQTENEQILTQALFKYEQDNDSKIAILSLDGKFKLLPNYNKNTDDFQVLTSYCAELINDKTLIYRVLQSGNTQSTIFKNKVSDTTKIGILSPMSINSKNDSIVISVSSMHPINEASGVIKEFYFYIFLGFILVAILLSFIYANLITKPLVKINKVAKKMSDMDFSAKCETTSKDEIGNLAITLNFLSSTLENTLDDLKEKNKKLTEDIEKERELEEMRKDFVTSVSHDLKTPIGIIEGYAEGLKDGIVTGNDTVIYLDTIIDEAHKMNKLVNNMLELSNLESGNIELNIEKFNILRLIQRLIKIFDLKFDAKNISLNLKTSLEYSYVLGDVFQLEQVLTNLISNTLKYTPSNKSVIIEVLKEDNLIKVSIENKGAHIPESEIEKLYTKFYRVDKARNRNISENSNGLGLAIVKRILTLHKSQYALSNTSDGVKFEFTLQSADDLEVF